MDFNQVKELFTLSNYENDSRYQQAVDTLVGIERKAARDAGYPVFRFDRANSQIVLRRSSSQDFELTYSLDEWEQMEQKYLPMSNSEKEFAAFVRTFIGNEMYDKFPDSEPDVGTPLTEFPKGVPGWVRKYYRLPTRDELIEVCNSCSARDIRHTYDQDLLNSYGYTFVSWPVVREGTEYYDDLYENEEYGWPMLVRNSRGGYELVNPSGDRIYGLADPKENF